MYIYCITFVLQRHARRQTNPVKEVILSFASVGLVAQPLNFSFIIGVCHYLSLVALMYFESSVAQPLNFLAIVSVGVFHYPTSIL